VLYVTLLALASFAPGAGAQQPEAQRVPLPGSDEKRMLVLLSSHEADPWMLSVTQGMKQVFEASGLRYSLWVESLDRRRNRGRGYFEDLLRLYRRKLETARFDVVITAGNEALAFALEHREALVPGVPLVFTGTDRIDLVAGASHADVTGSRESIEFRSTLDAALALHPDASTIVLLTPGLDRRYLVERLIPEYRPDLALEVWAEERLEEIVERLDALPPDAILVTVGEPRLDDGRRLGMDEFVRNLSSRSDAPLYTVWDVALGHGIVGGRLVSGEGQGATAARLALRILAGEQADSIPVVTEDGGQYRFDYRELDRLGLSLDALPPGSEVINRPIGFYEMHRVVLWSAAGIIVTLASFIAVLLRNTVVRRRVELALRESEARFHDFLDHSPTAISLMDRDGRFLLANRTFESLMGIGVEELLGRRSEELFAPEFARVSRDHDTEVLATGTSSSRQILLTRAGEARNVLTVKFPVRDGQGAVFGVGAVTVDVTDLKRAERALREREQRFREYAEVELAKARERLVRQTRLSAIGQVAASLAHDIRNPLGAIRNAAYYLGRRVPAAERKWQEYLRLIEREVVAADRIISHMMDMARERHLQRQQVDLGPLVDGVTRRLQPNGEVRIELGLEPVPFEVYADPEQLERVLDNLLSNAAQAVGKRGRIVVRARHDGPSDTISVVDDGPGVPESVEKHLFEPLVTTKAKGTGLGLAICEQIIRQHGGTIEHLRTETGGAEFRLVLPADPAHGSVLLPQSA
jgi:PAS domain S-box-containing protein